jgi:hypothetical protein
MDFENLNILPINNVLVDVDRIVVIVAEEENRNIDTAFNRTIKNMYNKHIRMYNQANPDKRRAIQQKYRETHPKSEIQKIVDKAYAKAYYLKKKEEKNRIINSIN